jgi:Fe-S cluster biogenesis protein NfuA
MIDAEATGARIETLLDASATGGRLAQERAEELVRLVADLYGAGLARILDLLHEQGALTDRVLHALAGDDLVAGLLLVHGLHPYPLKTRITTALAPFRGDVELLGVGDDVVRLRLAPGGGCGSAATRQAVEEAVLAVAPEIAVVEFAELAPVIPIRSLFTRVGGTST